VKLTIVAVGRLKESWFSDAAAEYLKRLGRYATVKVIEVPDQDISKDRALAVEKEGAALLSALPGSARVVALDGRGRERSSKDLARWLGDLQVRGTSHIVFVIGGTAGLAEAVLERADESLSLSRMTLPHQMARVFLLEQVYRAFRILRGEPYHH
jgi:23S rRNA (pseudouridine1915-N3)-methyltransferase